MILILHALIMIISMGSHLCNFNFRDTITALNGSVNESSNHIVDRQFTHWGTIVIPQTIHIRTICLAIFICTVLALYRSRSTFYRPSCHDALHHLGYVNVASPWICQRLHSIQICGCIVSSSWLDWQCMLSISPLLQMVGPVTWFIFETSTTPTYVGLPLVCVCCECLFSWARQSLF
ncbi:hypothetical protein M413DRAFT_239256 [Hebeloma cylindrosporum]|uniref:Uncharacterized protein n=1 Tax=Hebeloma cylindrosporum TaxID=76867 RepID=A0A0C3C3R7_HEBCY|nr:hypothetical protein M413DRAFT_239256 [Hebeloma cylindrosporum h7]